MFSSNLGMPVSYFEDLEPIHNSDLKGFNDSRERLLESKTYQQAKQLFRGLNKKVRKEQISFTDEMLGIQTNTNAFKLSLILYKSLFLYIIFKIDKKIKQSK